LNIQIYFTDQQGLLSGLQEFEYTNLFGGSARLIMDYVLKLQGHTSMSNLIGMPLLYFVVLA